MSTSRFTDEQIAETMSHYDVDRAEAVLILEAQDSAEDDSKVSDDSDRFDFTTFAFSQDEVVSPAQMEID